MAAKKAFPLRVNKEIWEAVRRWSDDELRSVNAQIEYVLRDALRKAATDAEEDPSAPIRFAPPTQVPVSSALRDKTGEIVELARQLVSIRSVTNCADERLDEVFRAARFVTAYLRHANVEVSMFDRGKYPAVLAHFPGRFAAPVMSILGIVEGIIYLTKSDEEFESTYIQGQKGWL